MNVLATPFRFESDGTCAKVVQGSDAHKAQRLAALVRTRPGELPLALAYGTPDPTFDTVSPGDIRARAAVYHPEINIKDVVLYMTPSGELAVEVAF